MSTCYFEYMLPASYLTCSITCYLQVINWIYFLFTRLDKKHEVILNKIFAPNIKKKELNTYISRRKYCLFLTTKKYLFRTLVFIV